MELIESTSSFLSTVVNVFEIYMYLGKTVINGTQFNGGGVVGHQGFDTNSGFLLNKFSLSCFSGTHNKV